MSNNKVYLVGDCHLSRLSEHYSEECGLEMIFWGKAAKSIYSLDFKKMYLEKELSSGKEEQRRPDDGVIPFSEIKDDATIVFWLGYVDIRTFLSKYKNHELIVERYINEIKNNFKNSKIIIAEPLPQFTEMLLKYSGISPEYTYEERVEQNELFLNYLKYYANLNGIKHFITQKEIYECLEVTKLTPEMTHNKAPHPVDGLKDEYNKNILNLFINKLKEINNE